VPDKGEQGAISATILPCCTTEPAFWDTLTENTVPLSEALKLVDYLKL